MLFLEEKTFKMRLGASLTICSYDPVSGSLGAVKVRGSPFHSWFWSYQRKIGQKKAIIAIARKLLMLIYLLLNTGQLYRQPVPET